MKIDREAFKQGVDDALTFRHLRLELRKIWRVLLGGYFLEIVRYVDGSMIRYGVHRVFWFGRSKNPVLWVKDVRDAEKYILDDEYWRSYAGIEEEARRRALKEDNENRNAVIKENLISKGHFHDHRTGDILMKGTRKIIFCEDLHWTLNKKLMDDEGITS